MNLKLEIEFSKAPILQEIDSLKKQIDAMRPLPPDVEGRVMQKLRLDWNYNSNAIEGNKLSYGETVAFLMEGITAKGKPLKDHLDIRGHNEAINFLLGMVKDDRPLSEADIRGLHEMILVEPYDVKAQTAEGMPTTKRIVLGVYKTTANHVQTATGETHYYATPEETPSKMYELMEWYYEVDSNAEIHPVVVAALFHHKFVAIHPFDDGNGRLSRILMNLVLLKKGYPPVVVKMDDRRNYYSLLNRADAGENWPFVEYVVECLQNSLRIYLKAANGQDIDESEDIGKEIALLQVQLNGGLVAKEKKDLETVKNVFFNSVYPLSMQLDNTSKSFHQYFFSNQNWLRFYFGENKTLNSEIEWIGPGYEEKYREILSDKTRIVHEVRIDLGFREYRNPDNSFSLTIGISILFEKFYYKISVENELLFPKLYHEPLIAEENNKIVKSFIQAFKYQFNEKLQSPKS